MIVILGERYGWIPEEQLISETIKAKADFELKELEKSVTALEIEYGALSRKEQLARTLFYFRDFENENMPDIYKTESERHAKKLKVLKDRIEKLAGGRVKYYTVGWDKDKGTITGLDGFVELVTQDVKALLTDEWQEYARLTPFEKDQRAQWNYAGQKAAQFSARENMIEDYREKLEHGQKLLVLQGMAGSGKSTLMSRFAVKLREEGYHVLPFFCGNTSRSDDTLDLIKNIVYYIEDYFFLPHREESEKENAIKTGGDQADTKGPQSVGNNSVRMWADKMAELIAYYEANAGETLVIFIDAADQLFADEARDKLMFIPTNLSEKVRMVISCLDTFALPSIREIEEVKPLENLDKQAVVKGITHFLGRELENCVIDKMIEKEASGSPLYLSLLIQRLVMMNKSDFDDITAHGDGMSAITAHQLELVEAASDTLHGVCVDILNTAATRIGGMLARMAAMYIAVSRHGLRESDLEVLLAKEGVLWNSLDFSLFIKYMRSFFILRDDGRYDFAHKSIREGFLAECTQKQLLHRNILRHFEGLDSHDAVRIQEIMYHCCNADDKKFLVHYINEYQSEDAIMDLAAKDIYEFSMQDDGRMMCGILADGASYGAKHEVLMFVNYDLDRAFGSSQKELKVQEKIVTETLALARRLEAEQGTAQARRDVTTCCYTLGDIYEIYDSRDYLERARVMYLEALKVREKLDQEEQSLASRSRLAYACYYMGYIYETDGSQASLEKALELYQRALKIREELAQAESTPSRKVQVASALADVGNIYKIFGSMEDLNHALEMYQRALQIRMEIAEEKETSANREKITDLYRSIAIIYELFGGREDLDCALELHQKVLEDRRCRASRDKSVASRKDLAASYIDLGDVYDAYRTGNDRQKSLAMYQEACKICEQLVKELGTARSKNDLNRIYHRIASVYGQFEDRENLNEALTLYQKALAVQEQLVREQNTADSIARIAPIYSGMGEAYRILNDRENLKLSLEMYQKAMDVQEQVTLMQQTPHSKEVLASYAVETGENYELLAGAENLRLAAEMFDKALRIQSAITEELKTTQSRNALAAIYYRIAENYRERGSRKTLELAIESGMKAVKIWESLAAEQETVTSKGRLAYGYSMAGSAYRKFETPEYLERAHCMYEKAKFIWAELVKMEAVQSRIPYMRVCLDLAEVCCDQSDARNLRKALGLYQEVSALGEQYVKEAEIDAEREILADSYAGCVRVYLSLKEQLSEAEELQQKSLEIRKCLDFELKTVRSKSRLIAAYSGMAEVYQSYEDVGHLNQARQMYETALKLGRELMAELDQAVSRRIVTSCLENLGDVYRALGKEQDVKKALHLYEEGLEIQKNIVSELGTFESKRMLVGYLERIAFIYKDSGSREGLCKALELFLRGDAILKEMVLEDDSAKCRGWLAGFCQNIGDVCYTLQGDQNLKTALEKYEEALENYRDIERELDTAKSREHLAYAYESTGNVYRRLGGRENLDRALEHYEQNLRLSERLDRETGTAANKKRVAVAYEKIADIYQEYGDREHLKQALELYQQESAIWETLTGRMSRCEILRGLAISSQKTAGIYKAFGEQEACEQALELYEKTIGFWQQLCEESGLIKDQRDIGICYERMGDIYRGREDIACLQRALEYYEAAVEIGERIAGALDTFDAWKVLAIDCNKSANVLRELGGKENILHAANRYNQAIEIRERLVQEASAPYMVKALEECYRKLANVYRRLAGEDKDYEAAALELYEKSLNITEKVVLEIETLPSEKRSEEERYIYRLRMMENCVNMGDLYLSQKQDTAGALELYEKAYRIGRIFMEERPDTEHKNYHGMCLARLLQIYSALDGEEYTKKSLDIGRESLELYESLLEEQKNVQIWDTYIFVLYQMIRNKLVSVSEKAEYAEEMLSESEKLYEITGNPRHRQFIETAEGFLKIIYGE